MLRILGVAALLASGAAHADTADTRSTKQLDEVVITADDSFKEFEAWKKALLAAIDKAPLKERSELTEHDKKQILVVQEDMPFLRKAVEDMSSVIADNPRASMLSEKEKLKLVQAYVRAQAILSNVPDELAIRCRMVTRPGQRNQEAACDLDYARAQQFLIKVGGGDKDKMSSDPKRRFGARAGLR